MGQLRSYSSNRRDESLLHSEAETVLFGTEGGGDGGISFSYVRDTIYIY